VPLKKNECKQKKEIFLDFESKHANLIPRCRWEALTGSEKKCTACKCCLMGATYSTVATRDGRLMSKSSVTYNIPDRNYHGCNYQGSGSGYRVRWVAHLQLRSPTVR
jgi:hypothetical protein